jgi:hypothetical protein
LDKVLEIRKKLRDFEQRFPGFQVVCDHLDCNGCSGVSKTNVNPTSKDLFACIKKKFLQNKCWYGQMQCFDYAPYRLILEQYADNKLLALEWLTPKILQIPGGWI